MKKTTLCYLEKDQSFLMLYRNRKKNDPNAGKWIGVGGKIEAGETADECMIREVYEETGLQVKNFHFYGVVEFRSDTCDDEDMYLYSCSDFSGDLVKDCNEGELAWIEKNRILRLSLWEGDRYFLEKMLSGCDQIHMRLMYHADVLTDCLMLQ